MPTGWQPRQWASACAGSGVANCTHTPHQRPCRRLTTLPTPTTPNPQEVNGRRVTILLHNNIVRCFDSLCYHMGGELGAAGDVEDFQGRACIVCPSHGHRIDLENGQRLDTDLTGHLVCDGVGVQRIHRAVVDADGSVRIVLHDGGFPKPSDKYNSVGPPRAGAPRGLGAFGPAAAAGPLVASSSSAAAPTTVDAFKPDASDGVEPYGGVSKRATALQAAAPPSPSPAAGTVTALFRAAKSRTGVAIPATAPPPARSSALAAMGGAAVGPPGSPSRNAFAARGAAARAAVLAGGRHRVPVAPRPLPSGQASLTQLWRTDGGSGGSVEAMEI